MPRAKVLTAFGSDRDTQTVGAIVERNEAVIGNWVTAGRVERVADDYVMPEPVAAPVAVVPPAPPVFVPVRPDPLDEPKKHGGRFAKRAGVALLLLSLLSGPVFAATDMLGASGLATTGASTCPAAPISPCSGGWFSVGGLYSVAVHVWASTGTASATTVKLWGRLDSTDTAYLLKEWTNPTSTQVAVAVDGFGEIRLEVTANDVTLKGKISATSSSGTRRW